MTVARICHNKPLKWMCFFRDNSCIPNPFIPELEDNGFCYDVDSDLLGIVYFLTADKKEPIYPMLAYAFPL